MKYFVLNSTNQWPTPTKCTCKIAYKIDINKMRNRLLKNPKWYYLKSKTNYALKISMFSLWTYIQVIEMDSNFWFSFLPPLQFPFTSKWHKSQHKLISKDTNYYFLFSICPRDKRNPWSLLFRMQNIGVVGKAVWKHMPASVQLGQAVIIYYLINWDKNQTEN